MSVAVLGAGAFGTALAISQASKAPVYLWARDGDMAAQMQAGRENVKYLSGATLPKSLTVTADLGILAACDVCLLAVPMQKLRGFLTGVAPLLDGKTLVACCKGVELGSGLGPLEIIAEHCPRSPLALLTGPSFAKDIAAGLPTALTLACTDPERARRLQHQLATPSLRLYRTGDVIGASLGGALKNVIAVASGATIGAGFGESARAALMTRGHAEMMRYATHAGANPETLFGLSGFGDLVLTCTSMHSRNYALGYAIGTKSPIDPSVTVEGAATARAISDRAKAEGIDMPISTTVAALVEKRLDVQAAVTLLLSRTLKEE